MDFPDMAVCYRNRRNCLPDDFAVLPFLGLLPTRHETFRWNVKNIFDVFYERDVLMERFRRPLKAFHRNDW